MYNSPLHFNAFYRKYFLQKQWVFTQRVTKEKGGHNLLWICELKIKVAKQLFLENFQTLHMTTD